MAIYGAIEMIYKDYTEAYAAAQIMRKQHSANGIMVKVERSPYGGFQIKLIPIDLMIDDLSNNPSEIKSKRPTVNC
jgi:hypothetical protein